MRTDQDYFFHIWQVERRSVSRGLRDHHGGSTVLGSMQDLDNGHGQLYEHHSPDVLVALPKIRS